MEMEERGRQEEARKKGEDKKKSCYYRTCCVSKTVTGSACLPASSPLSWEMGAILTVFFVIDDEPEA